MSKHRYTATIFCEDTPIAKKSSDDLVYLEAWMLCEGKGQFGERHGIIYDASKNEVIKHFRRTASE